MRRFGSYDPYSMTCLGYDGFPPPLVPDRVAAG
ncbi:MAG: hypothetical protein EPO23_11135 [Xanthobacteraceae bacterium]|nr:MAG: hypothetical protein EPO23_11135 [Xanthobacteraceae bacterium]